MFSGCMYVFFQIFHEMVNGGERDDREQSPQHELASEADSPPESVDPAGALPAEPLPTGSSREGSKAEEAAGLTVEPLGTAA